MWQQVRFGATALLSMLILLLSAQDYGGRDAGWDRDYCADRLSEIHPAIRAGSCSPREGAPGELKFSASIPGYTHAQTAAVNGMITNARYGRAGKAGNMLMATGLVVFCQLVGRNSTKRYIAAIIVAGTLLIAGGAAARGYWVFFMPEKVPDIRDEYCIFAADARAGPGDTVIACCRHPHGKLKVTLTADGSRVSLGEQELLQRLGKGR